MRALGTSLDLDEMLPGSKIGKLLSSLNKYFSDITEIEKSKKKKRHLKMLCFLKVQGAFFDINH